MPEISMGSGHGDSVSCLQFDDSKVVSGSLDSSLKVRRELWARAVSVRTDDRED